MRRQSSRCPRELHVLGSRCHLPDHPVFDNGRICGRMVRSRPPQYLWRDGAGTGNAKRRRRRRRRARVAASRSADNDIHSLARTAADDSQHVQDCRRAAPDSVPRVGTYFGQPRIEHIRRSSGRDVRTPDRIRYACRRFGTGSYGLGRCGTSGRHQEQRTFRQLL